MAVDKLQYAIGNAASTTLASSVTNTDTSFPLTSDTNFAAKSGEGFVIIDEGEGTEELAYATTKTGGALTIPLANRGLEGGSAQAHSASATVKGTISATMWNNIVDALINLVSKSTGLLDTTKVVDLTTAQVLTNKTLTTPQINDTSSDHQYVFAGSELTADRTVTLPLLTGNDEFMFKAHSQTVTNKRIEPRIVTAASYTTDTGTSLDVSTTDQFQVTAQAGALLFNAPSGTPVAGQKLIIRIKDDGTARALTWNAVFRAMGTALPSTTVLSKTLYLGFIYNFTDTKWDLVASAQES